MHLTTVVRYTRECLTTVHASHDSRETFARVSHDVRANFNQFYFLAIKSGNGLIISQSIRICIAYFCSVRSRKLNSDVPANVCKVLATGSRHMR